MPIVYASDGLRARDNGVWGEQKLSFLDEFVPRALQATTRKHTRVYLDLFAGPGVNVARGRGTEFDGSPLRALRLHAPGKSDLTFTHAVFVNYSRRDHAALEARIARAVAEGRSLLPEDRILPTQDDANAFIPRFMERIDRRAYVFAFADIEAPR
jgi:three-Cys-motif partner protein